ncbi:hypothetical protein DPMN_170016 [Dreissena polymorpha]|uniref:Uncharacterized protein n=1 Tax=Dreissena polymorpha TaxID=45954 RepID=A0A9D4ICI5_DREPO|nr:hypothetical protein DPMN_170016 [Dreissena polymorpha]
MSCQNGSYATYAVLCQNGSYATYVVLCQNGSYATYVQESRDQPAHLMSTIETTTLREFTADSVVPD